MDPLQLANMKLQTQVTAWETHAAAWEREEQLVKVQVIATDGVHRGL